MKQTLNMRRQLAVTLKYCYLARRATQNMSARRSLPTFYSRSRSVTSMGHQGTKSFVRVAEIFQLCPIVINYVQNIFQRGKILHYPWLRAWAEGGNWFGSEATLRRPRIVWSKSQFKLASTLTFTVTSWRIFQIWRYSWMLPRATENAVAGTCGPRVAI